MAETNGMNGHCGKSLDFKVGLLNSSTKKYLTAETFGSCYNVSGTQLKKKQIWTLEQDQEKENTVYLKSCTEKRIGTEPKAGEVSSDRGYDERFSVEYGTGDNAGQWLFRHSDCGTYLGTDPSNNDNVLCKSNKPRECDYWIAQLYIHPQINLKNLTRKTYVHLVEDKLVCSEVIPWGTDALITLEFVDGRYAFKTHDGRYLQNNGELVGACKPTDECLFSLEIKSGKDAGLTFKDCNQCYLTAAGSGVIKTNKKTVSRDEIFTIEDSHPQVFFIRQSGKKASIKQGVDVSANQDGEEDTETFQIEYRGGNQWAVLASNGKYWTLSKSGAGIQAVSSEVKQDCIFDFEWQGDGTVLIKASNSKYISHKETGALIATVDSPTDKEMFKVQIINRPLLVLKCKHGFVGLKPKSTEYACNKANYDVFNLTSTSDGKYTVKDSDGNYWRVDGSGVVVRDESPSSFVIEFRKKTFISIKAENGCYLQGKQNGQIVAKVSDMNSEESGTEEFMWEF